ncbi:MAG: type II toxin-antitoxin system VapC family toxin [Cyanobacteria bacterium P01_H01_bin.35]
MKNFSSHLILDTCCLINFWASGYPLEILKVIPAQVAVTQVVLEEELQILQRLKNEGDESATQFEIAIDQDIVKIVDFESEAEAETFLNYLANNLGDGEAATSAIAFHRGWAIATDDRRAIPFIQQEAPHIEIFSTPEIIKYWSEERKIDFPQLSEALNAVEKKGRYSPPKSHHLRSWWENYLGR